MQLENTHDRILNELGLDYRIKINSPGWSDETYLDPKKLVSHCHSGLLVFNGRLPDKGYPLFVQNMIDGKDVYTVTIDGKDLTGKNISLYDPLPMTKCDQVKLVGFDALLHGLEDMLKYTDPELFPSLVGVLCTGILVKNDDDYKILQTITSRLKYFRCNGDITYYTGETQEEGYNRLLPPPYTGPKQIQFKNLRFGSFQDGFTLANKFKLDLPECEVISISLVSPGWEHNLANSPFEIVSNPKNKLFRFGCKWSDNTIYVNPVFSSSLEGFTFIEEILFDADRSCSRNNSDMIDMFMPLKTLKRFHCLTSQSSDRNIFKWSMDSEDAVLRLLVFHKRVLDFVVKKKGLEQVVMRYGPDYDYIRFAFKKVEKYLDFPSLVIVTDKSGLAEYDDACEKACRDRDDLIGLNVAHAFNNARVPWSRNEIKASSTLEEMMEALTLENKVAKTKPLVLADKLISLIASYLQPR